MDNKKVKEKNVEKVVEVEKEKNYSISRKSQKRLKGITKFLYIITKISKVFAIIGIVGLFIAMIFVPIFTSNIKVNKNEEESYVEVFDSKVYYSRNEDRITIYEKDKEDSEIIVRDKDDVKNLNQIIDYIEESDFSKISLIVEFNLVLLSASLFIVVFMLNKTYLLFKNIHEENTPFTKENTELLNNIGKYLFLLICISLFISFVNSIVFNSDISLSFTNIYEILIVYVLVYICEYGCKLQANAKGSIYSKGE